MWLPALAAASIIKVIMAGQRMRQPARDRNGSYTALLAAGADIHPSMAMCKLRPGGAAVRPPYPRVTGAFTGRCLMRPGRWRTRGMAPPGHANMIRRAPRVPAARAVLRRGSPYPAGLLLDG
jgi:hypothetical protein